MADKFINLSTIQYFIQGSAVRHVLCVMGSLSLTNVRVILLNLPIHLICRSDHKRYAYEPKPRKGFRIRNQATFCVYESFRH